MSAEVNRKWIMNIEMIFGAGKLVIIGGCAAICRYQSQVPPMPNYKVLRYPLNAD